MNRKNKDKISASNIFNRMLGAFLDEDLVEMVFKLIFELFD